MFNRKTRQIILEIPKNGSRSLVEAAKIGYGKKAFNHHGHKTLRELLALVSPKQGEVLEVVGVVRDPYERFVSQIINYMQIKGCSLDDAMLSCIEQSHIIFKPQRAFLDLPETMEPMVTKRIFTMDQQHLAQNAVYGGSLRHEISKNRTKRNPAPQNLRGHRLFEQAYGMFDDDLAVVEEYYN